MIVPGFPHGSHMHFVHWTHCSCSPFELQIWFKHACLDTTAETKMDFRVPGSLPVPVVSIRTEAVLLRKYGKWISPEASAYVFLASFRHTEA